MTVFYIRHSVFSNEQNLCWQGPAAKVGGEPGAANDH
jgi:hypothetical protein